jgi:hypothetical protein
VKKLRVKQKAKGSPKAAFTLRVNIKAIRLEILSSSSSLSSFALDDVIAAVHFLSLYFL